MKERKHDPYYLMAKKVEYKSRAAFKLIQLQEKFNLIRRGDWCLDLGSAPGGWVQVELEYAGNTGKVCGIDLVRIPELPPAMLFRGDIRKIEDIAGIVEAAGGKFDVVLSDASPKISGNYSLDHARSAELARQAAVAAKISLKKGGNFAAKLFDGEERNAILRELEEMFETVTVSKPPASRKQSSELYIIAKGFR